MALWGGRSGLLLAVVAATTVGRGSQAGAPASSPWGPGAGSSAAEATKAAAEGSSQASVDSGSSPCAQEHLYDAWLSRPEVFIRQDQPAGFAGLYVVCIWKGDDGVQLEAYENGLLTEKPLRGVLQSEGLASWTSFRQHLAKALSLEKVTNNWQYQGLKQDFGVFAPFGRRVISVAAALQARLLFVTVGGQWFWPPVRTGFVRQLEDIGMQLETLSVQPVVYKVRGFLKHHECEHIIELGKPSLEASPVTLMDKDKGKQAKDFRTSSQARVPRSSSAVLRNIDKRVGRLTRVPHYYNEEVQILRYDKTQYYSAHLDNWDPQFYSDSRFFQYGHDNRYITVFWYLSDVAKGGQTLFPRALGLPQPRDVWACDQGLKVRPEKGSVILWYSLHPNGNTDPNGLHSACAVEDGQKWAANYWVWSKPRHRAGKWGATFAEQPNLQVDDSGIEEEVLPTPRHVEV